jgi:hypothetical protein
VRFFTPARWLTSLTITLGTATGPAPRPAVPVPAATGRIEGTVVLAPSLSARKPRFRPYADYGPTAAPPKEVPDTNELVNVVVYLDSVPGGSELPAPSGTPTLEQLNEHFVPHVLPVLKGATVEFPNRDPVFHNVFSLSSTRTFDLGRFPKGESKSIRFPKAGLVQVFCHIHSDMSAVIMVLDNPLFAVPNLRGHYVIEGVPPGEYRVVAWHERIKPISDRVRVTAGQTATLDFTIPLPAPPSQP